MKLTFNESFSFLKKQAGVYEIYCSENDKFYIGSSNNLAFRLRCHKSQLRYDNSSSTYMQHSWNKYGEKSFSIYIIETCEQGKETDREQFWLDNTHCWNPSIGFNTSKYADIHKNNLGKKMSDEQKLKLSKALKNNPKLQKKKIYNKEEKIRSTIENQGTNYSLLSSDNQVYTGRGIADLARKLNMRRGSVSNLVNNKHGYWREWVNLLNLPRTIKFLSPNNIIYEVFVNDLYRFYKHYNLTQQRMAAIIRKDSPHHKGWSLLETPLKKYKIFSPNNTMEIVYDDMFLVYARKYNINEKMIYKIKQNKFYKGWRCEEWVF